MPVLVAGIAAPELRWGQAITAVPGPNERIIELPLAFDLLGLGTPGIVLDAGCACNASMWDPPVPDITHFTQALSSETIYDQPHRRYVAGDLRDLSRWADRTFDRIVCISTLEHVGLDNSAYDAPVEDDPNSVVQAVSELWRVCKGTLLITVPYHRDPWHSAKWRYFTAKTLRQLVPTTANGDLVWYTKDDDGWRGPLSAPAPSAVEAVPVRQIAAIKLWR